MKCALGDITIATCGLINLNRYRGTTSSKHEQPESIGRFLELGQIPGIRNIAGLGLIHVAVPQYKQSA